MYYIKNVIGTIKNIIVKKYNTDKDIEMTQYYNNGDQNQRYLHSWYHTKKIRSKNMIPMKKLLKIIHDWEFIGDNCNGIIYTKNDHTLYGFSISLYNKNVLVHIGNIRVKLSYTLVNGTREWDSIKEKQIIYAYNAFMKQIW